MSPGPTPKPAPALTLLVAAALLPAILLAYLASSGERRAQAWQDSADQASQLSRGAASGLARDLAAVDRALRLAAAAKPGATQESRLIDMAATLPFAGVLEVVGSSGELLAASRVRGEANPPTRADRPWFRGSRAETGSATLSEAYRLRGSNAFAATLARGTETGRVAAFTFEGDAVSKRLSAEAREPGAEVLVIDQAGTVIGATRDGWVGRSFARGSDGNAADKAARLAFEVLAGDGVARMSSIASLGETRWIVLAAWPVPGAASDALARLAPLLALASVLLALAGATLAWRALRRVPSPGPAGGTDFTTWSSALESLGLGFWQGDLVTRTATYSPQCAHLLGEAAKGFTEPLSKWPTRVHPEDLPGLEAALRRFESGGQVILEHEVRYRMGDGSWRWILARGLAVERDANGRARRLVGTAEDAQARRAERAMAADTEQMMRSIFDHGPHPIIVFRGSDGRILDANPAALSRLGLTREELQGRTATELGLWVDDGDRDALLRAVREDGRATELEVRVRARSGEVLNWIVYAERFGSADSDLLLTHSIDVTRERRAQAQVRESSQLFRGVFEASLLAIVISRHEDGRVWMVNPAACRLFGYQTEELIGRTTLELGLWDSAASRERALAVLGDAGELRDYEFLGRTKTGSVRTALMNAILFEAAGEQLILSVVGDITQRKKAEAELKGVRDQLERQIAAMPIACIVMDERFCVLQWNPAAERVFGYTMEEVHGQCSLDMLVPASDLAIVKERLGSLREQGENADGVNVNITKDGREIVCEWRNIAIRDPEGRFQAYLCMALDVTERTRAQRAAERFAGELERRVGERTAELSAAVEELEAFSYSVAHDLRSPLRAIDAYLRIAEEGSPGLTDESRAFIDKARSSIERMAGLIEDLLDLARIGRAELEPHDVDMQRVVEASLRELAAAYPKTRTRIGALPVVRGDAVLLRQAMDNLLANAFKFSAKSADPLVDVEAVADGGNVTYVVRDNGVGFDMAWVGKLFGVFERLHPGSEYPGSGVGLAIVRRVALRHGGSVAARSDPAARRTEFSITLPS